jgi:hypothetical protein
MPLKPEGLYDHLPTNWDFVEQEVMQTVNITTAQAVMTRLMKVGLNILDISLEGKTPTESLAISTEATQRLS